MTLEGDGGRHPTFEGPLPSKEQLVFSTGFRSFEARPVFSENNLNSDKHKFQRFLHPGNGMRPPLLL